MSTRTRKSWTPWQIAWALVKSAGGLAVVFVGWQYWLYNGGIFRTSNFDEVEWKSLSKNTDDSSCYRGGMAHDIKTNILRAGLTKTEVERLLGAPDSNSDDINAYSLGMCSGLRIDFDSLDVHFNPEGRLVKVQVVQH
jgi:hypothetical protein